MNLRSILQGLSLCLFFVLCSINTQAQSPQLAGVSQDGLIQLGANHPFVVDEYIIDVSHVGLANNGDAVAFFGAYAQGFSFTFDLVNDKVYFKIPVNLIFDIPQVPVQMMNQKLADIHRLSR